jgi:hypothetical protein
MDISAAQFSECAPSPHLRLLAFPKLTGRLIVNQRAVTDECLEIANWEGLSIRKALVEDVIDESKLVASIGVNEVHP